MFLKSFFSILIVTLSFVLVFGQTPEEKKEKATAPQAFAFSFDGDGGYLGVSTQEISKENFAKFGLRDVRGVAVEKVLENSPAAAAGIQNGDVIVRFNGEEITSTRKLTRLVSEVAPDHQVKVTVLRGGTEQELTATLAKRPMPKFENGNFSFGPMGKLNPDQFKLLPQIQALPQMRDFPRGDMPRIFGVPDGEGQSFAWRSGEGRQIGISVYAITKQLGERYGVESGVMINNVRDGSPAAKAGLKAGDIIVEIDGKTVKGDLDLIRAINAKKEGDITLTIVRDRNRQTISVTPEASKDSGFMFQTDDEDGLTLTPGQVLMPRPSTMVTPTVAPVPMTAPMRLVRPGRVI